MQTSQSSQAFHGIPWSEFSDSVAGPGEPIVNYLDASDDVFLTNAEWAMPWSRLPLMDPDASNTIMASSTQGEVSGSARAVPMLARTAIKALIPPDLRLRTGIFLAFPGDPHAMVVLPMNSEHDCWREAKEIEGHYKTRMTLEVFAHCVVNGKTTLPR